MDKNNNLETLCISDIEFQTNLTDSFKNRKKWTRPNKKDVLSHIPGNILKIFVKEGQKVRAQNKLLILEAMKMENIIISPVSGTVKKVCVSEGDMVPKNTILIELE